MKSDKEPSLSIVIGALNEEKRIGDTLNALSIYLKKSNLEKSTEVIVVAADGGDKTKEIARNYSKSFTSFKLIEPGEVVGKGRDIRDGMLATKGDIRLFMDADLATPLHYISTILTIFKDEHPDIVIGTRKLSAFHHSPFRRIVSIVGNMCFFLVAGFYSPDTQCGFKAFTAESTEICFKKLTRLKWSFDMELLTIAHSNQLEVRQLKITDWLDKPGGTFKPSLRNSWQFFKDLVRIFTYRVTGKYKLRI